MSKIKIYLNIGEEKTEINVDEYLLESYKTGIRMIYNKDPYLTKKEKERTEKFEQFLLSAIEKMPDEEKKYYLK